MNENLGEVIDGRHAFRGRRPVWGSLPDGVEAGGERAADVHVGMVADVTARGRNEAKPRDRLFEDAPIGLPHTLHFG
ncbi:MAG TPA: hypothetical protein VNG89_15320, partial [Vicinamibacterales bacterium]|nr:hypothetical protein [Vicinamibacterales bacterium]